MTTSFFADYARSLTSHETKKIVNHPFKEHPCIPVMIDTLSRCENHHLMIISSQTEYIHLAFMEYLAQQLTHSTTPKALREANLIYLDVKRFTLAGINPSQVKENFLTLLNEAQNTKIQVILVLNQTDFLHSAQNTPALEQLKEAVHSILLNVNCRLIAFTRTQDDATLSPLSSYFYALQFNEPHKSELLALLKLARTRLEESHQVIISDETFTSAYSLAAHYLPGKCLFDKALMLLDSSAARASATERHEQGAHKPIVTSHLLAQVISSWTQIPLTHLQNIKFQLNKFLEGLRKTIIGQDIATNQIATNLQNAYLKLSDVTGPLCSFLFAGPTDVGKTETAKAIAEQLFGHRNALIKVNLNNRYLNSLSQLQVTYHGDESHSVSLLAAIQQTPYAVVLWENIDTLDLRTSELFDDLLMYGIAYDELGNKYDFRHAIIIMTTRVNIPARKKNTSAATQPETTKTVDLMQLVLNDNVQESDSHPHHEFSPQEFCDAILPKLTKTLPKLFLQKLNVVPFVTLDYATLENLMRLKIKSLTKRLETQFGIHLNYAQEVIKFLSNEVFWNTSEKSLECLLEQHLYSCLAHEILLHADDKNRSKHLLVQLNDTGQLLRAEFVHTTETALI